MAGLNGLIALLEELSISLKGEEKRSSRKHTNLQVFMEILRIFWLEIRHAPSHVGKFFRLPVLGFRAGPWYFKAFVALVDVAYVAGWGLLVQTAIQASQGTISDDEIRHLFPVILMLVFFHTTLGNIMFVYWKEHHRLPARSDGAWLKFISTFLAAQGLGFVITWIAYDLIGGWASALYHHQEGLEEAAVFAWAGAVQSWLGLVVTFAYAWVARIGEKQTREMPAGRKAGNTLQRTKWTQRISWAGLALWGGLTTMIFLVPEWVVMSATLCILLLAWGTKLAIEVRSSLLTFRGKRGYDPYTVEDYRQVGLNSLYLQVLTIPDIWLILLLSRVGSNLLDKVIGGDSTFFSLLTMNILMGGLGLFMSGLIGRATAIIKSR